MALRVLISDRIAEEGVGRLMAEPGLEVVVETDLTQEALLNIIGNFDGLVVRSSTQVTADLLAAAKQLKVIGRAGVGVDNIDVAAATKRGIIVINTPEGNTTATAEHTIAMMLAMARRIPQAHHALVHLKRWERNRFMGVQVQGKTLGVVGLGRVGSEVARRAVALDMRVLGFDPFISPDRAHKLGVHLASLDEICREAHFITVHVPMTKANEGLIGPEQFAQMRRGVYLINCARGGIIDESALLAALRSGVVAGAALDVFVTEPPGDHPLLAMENVIATPHLGGSTHEAQVSVAVDVAEGVIRALRGEPVRGAVNAPIFAEAGNGLRPYLELCERLGHLYTEVLGGRHERVEIILSGEAAKFDSRALTTAVLKGMLAPILHESVNFVNAPILAEERGIRVVETKVSEAEDLTGLVTLRGRQGNMERTVAGTVMADRLPTLVAIDGYRVMVATQGHMLLANNVDRPGVIGKVGTVLGEANINIAFMQVGRKSVGEDALMIVGVDHPIPDHLLQKLASVAQLRNVRVVEW